MKLWGIMPMREGTGMESVTEISGPQNLEGTVIQITMRAKDCPIKNSCWTAFIVGGRQSKIWLRLLPSKHPALSYSMSQLSSVQKYHSCKSKVGQLVLFFISTHRALVFVGRPSSLAYPDSIIMSSTTLHILEALCIVTAPK